MAMNLAAFTLKPPTSVAAAVVGRFSDAANGKGGEEEVVTIRGGHYLEVARLTGVPEGNGGGEAAGVRLEPVLRQDAFSTLRSLCKIRPVGASKDYLVVGSDSGRLCLLELVRYDRPRPGEEEQEEGEEDEDGTGTGYYRLRCSAWMPLGPGGCRRAVPGQYVAADPKGRAVFTASVDGHKAAAAVVRNPETGRLELRLAQGFAKASGTATVLSVVALDVGAAEKPAFAVLAGRDQDDIRQEQAAEREVAGLELPDDSLKHVTVYELDLSTNTMATDAKRWRLPASRTGCGLLPVPASAGLGGSGGEGEGALLVLSENWVGLKHRTAFKELRAPFPRPKGLAPAQGVLPVAWVGVGAAVEREGSGGGGGGGFVALVQSEWGDMYEVTVSAGGTKGASGASPSLRIRALPDWLPPCAALAALRGGKLVWAAAEAGDHTLQLRRPLKAGALGKGREALPTKEAGVGDGSEEAAKVAPVFERANAGDKATLVEVGREGSLACCLKLVAGPGQGAGRVAALCGRGAASGVRVLEGGLPVVEELEAPLPFKLTGVWSLAPAGSGSNAPTYLLLSGAQRTAVLEVGEALVEVEAEARGFVADSRTIEAGAVGGQGQGQGLVQVVPSQLRYVVAAGAGEKGRGGSAKSSGSGQQPPKVTEWRPPGRREIDRAALSASCVALAMGGVEVAVFSTAALARAAAVGGGGEEVKPQATRDLGVDISALHIVTLPSSQSQPPQTLVVVGTMDLAVRVLAYEEGKGGSLEERFKVTLSHRPESFASLPSLFGGINGDAAVLQLCVGLASGEAQWMAVEVTSASVGGGAAARASLALRLGRSRSVGAGRPVRLVSLQVGGRPAVLALAPGTQSPAWLFYPHGRLQGPPLLAEHPLAYAPMEAAAPIALRALPEALVAVTGSGSGGGAGAGSLRLLWLEQPLEGLGLTEDAFPHALAHTPRAFAPLPRSHVVVVAEGDASASACPPPRRASSSSTKEGDGDGDGDEDSHMEVDEDEDGEQGGAQAALEGGKAGGLLRVLEPGSGTTRQILPLEEGLMPVAVAAVRFRCAPPNELFVVAAVVPIRPPQQPQQQQQQQQQQQPGSAKGGAAAVNINNTTGGLPPATGYLYTYRCLPSGLQLAHRTPVDEPEVGAPRALCAFAEEGRLLVGFGPATTQPGGAGGVVAAPRVRVYDLGKRRLLRKCDSGPLADDPRLARAGGGIVRLDHRGPWVFATDALKGVQALHYSAQENRLRPVADDPVPRLVSDALVIDRTSVAAADRLGSLFLLRLPWETALAMDGGSGGGGDSDDGAGAGAGGAAGGAAGVTNPMSRRAFWEACGDVGEGSEGLGAFPSKLEAVAEYHVGEVVTSLARARLGTRGDREALVFSTVAGALGTLCPLGTQREREVLSALEAAILKGEPASSSAGTAAAASSSSSSSTKRRKTDEAAAAAAAAAAAVVEGDDATLFPTGRDHLSYRAGPTGSRPARGVIDLDLIAQAGPARRARTARAAKLDPAEAEAVVTEALAAMALSRRAAAAGAAAGAGAGGSGSA